jgi:CheY-like chemotaxis protein
MPLHKKKHMDQIANNRIMIVGRDSHFLYLIQRFVRTSAHQIVMANLGDDGLALARCEKPEAIVLEVDQPETAGWLTLRTLKADPEAGKIPVIACSWLDEEARGLAEGADNLSANANFVYTFWRCAGDYPGEGAE